MTQNNLDAVASIFLAIPGLKLSKNSQKISVGHAGVKPSETMIKFLMRYLTPALKKELVTNYPEIYCKLDEGEPAPNIEAKILEGLSAKKQTRSINLEEVFDTAVPVPLSRVLVLINAEDVTLSVMFDPETEKVFALDYRRRDAVLKRHLPDDEVRAQWIYEHSKSCWFKYYPHQPKFFQAKDGELIFNQWSPAPYTLGRQLDPNVESLPEDFLKVFEHLFPIPSERGGVLSWLRTATFSRCKTVLLLAGIPGCGKGVFMEKFLRQLVGEENWSKAPANFGSTDFNGDLRNKLVYLLNEQTINKLTKDKIKDLTDGTGTIHQKHEKTKGVEDIYSSFAISNNYIAGNYLEFSDRKFYVPTLNDKKLDDVYGEEWVTEFAEVTCKDPEFLNQVASYLYYKVRNKHIYPQTELFKKICEMSLPKSFRKFLLFCKNRETFSEKDLAKSCRKEGTDFYSLNERLEVYQKETKQVVAEIHEGLEGWIATSFICGKESDPAKIATKMIKAQQKVKEPQVVITENVL